MIHFVSAVLVAIVLGPQEIESLLAAPSCPIRDLCPGDSVSGLPEGETWTERLQALSNKFCGCVVVSGSVNVFVDNPPTVELTEEHFDFLYHVKEIWNTLLVEKVHNASIRMPNLVLIRGEQRSSLGDATIILSNSTLNELNLPMFREISHGSVRLQQSIWCGVQSVDWRDIIEAGTDVIYDPISLVADINASCPAVGEACNASCDTGHCWSHNQCQALNKVVCSPFCSGSRCAISSGSTACCDNMCLAGCNQSVRDCIACRNLVENGSCVDACTPKETVDQNGMMSFNQAGNVQVGIHLCLPSCTGVLVEMGGQCVESCASGFFISGRACQRCVGDCPNGVECDGWNSDESVVYGDTLQQFMDKECAVVNGHIIFNSRTIEGFIKQNLTQFMLERFRFVKVIRGSLQIQFWDNSLPSMNYFRNVEYIGSQDLTTAASSGRSILIGLAYNRTAGFDTGMAGIDLSRLQQITHGNVLLAGNPMLCYYGDFFRSKSSFFQFEEQNVVLARVNGAPAHRDMATCESNNMSCHSECVRDSWCWGPEDTNCVECVNFYHQRDDRCVPNCNEYKDTFQNNDTEICEQCHQECAGCRGEGPFNCIACRTYAIHHNESSTECVSQCPFGFYLDGSVRVCVPCNGPCPQECQPSEFSAVTNGNAACFPCNGACVQCVNSDSASFCTSCAEGYLVEQSRTEMIRLVAVGNGTVTFVERTFTLLTCMRNSSTSAGSEPGPSIQFWYWIIVAVCVGLVAVIVVAFACCLGYYFIKRKKKYEVTVVNVDDSEYAMVAMPPDAGLTLLPQPKMPPNLARITIVPEDSLEVHEELGCGAFGTVYKGLWRPEGEDHQYTVAIKVLNTSTPEAQTELLEEGVAMAAMEHSNVVRLYALCMGENMMLVSQYVMMGSLLSFLRKHKNQLNADTMMTFIHQISEGMLYLEEKRMVHRDLAARNVLVHSYTNVKISDFGLTKCLDIGETEYKSTGGKVPVRWLALECLFKKEYSHKSDVWACGVTIWEILTFGGRPYLDKNTKEVVVSVSKGTRLPQPQTCSIELYSTMLSCWLANPDSRPDFSSLCSKFAHFCEDPARYISTTADQQLTDYSQLPTNDPAVVDVGAYELPVLVEPDGSSSSTEPFPRPMPQSSSFKNADFTYTISSLGPLEYSIPLDDFERGQGLSLSPSFVVHPSLVTSSAESTMVEKSSYTDNGGYLVIGDTDLLGYHPVPDELAGTKTPPHYEVDSVFSQHMSHHHHCENEGIHYRNDGFNPAAEADDNVNDGEHKYEVLTDANCKQNLSDCDDVGVYAEVDDPVFEEKQLGSSCS